MPSFIRLVFIGLLCLLPLVSNYASQTTSVLKEGLWVKIRVDKTGIYSLSDADLKDMGFADPSKVSVFGYGGAMLSEDFSQPYTSDLPQIANIRYGNQLIFHAQGTTSWTYESSSKAFTHTNNPYSTYAYYFLSDALPTKAITQAETLENNATAAMIINSFDDYALHEKDIVSPNRSGRELFGESFITDTSQDFAFYMPGITNDDGLISMRFISKTLTSSGQVTLAADNKVMLQVNIYQSTNEGLESYQKAVAVYLPAEWEGEKQENTTVNVSYDGAGHTNVHLDYIRMQAKRQLSLYEDATYFRSIATIGNVSNFKISGTDESTAVIDVTDRLDPKLVSTSFDGNETTFFTIPAGDLREFVAINTNATFSKPEIVGKIDNQDLHSHGAADMIIISPPSFKAEAERLAAAHQAKSGLTTIVADPTHIYNEFSSGTPDATAYRRYLQHIYKKGQVEDKSLKFLLLMGDAAYDNRFLCDSWKNANNENLLLSYQSQESLGIFSYTTDDYFGFLDDNEGKNLSSDKIDIGIGRFPIQTSQQAKAAVDKSIAYMNNSSRSNWKNKISFIADDGSVSDEFTLSHTQQSNTLASYMESEHPEFISNKIFFDSYKKDLSTGNGSFPDVETLIDKNLEDGILLINYTGHGSTQYWSDEQVMSQSKIKQYNYEKLPIWITASCDFTRFDDISTSAGEDVFLNQKSAGIALFTTSRVVFSGPNFTINQKLIENIFKRSNGERMTFGEIMMNTKRAIGSDANKLNFALIGDPALRLAYPEYSMAVTSINGEGTDGEPIFLKAADKITVEGKVTDQIGNTVTDFNGQTQIVIFDSKEERTTLDNNNTGVTLSYTDYPNALYVGNGSVKDGIFTFSFTVPKDISYSNDFGKMNLYAASDSLEDEAQGAFLNFKVGGSADNAEVDTIAPAIHRLYLNDTTFVDGSDVNSTPLLVVDLSDESGINISGGGIGHDLTLRIDNDALLTYNLNSYFEIVDETNKMGRIAFPIPEMSNGVHTAELKVWDVMNNSTTAIFNFNVTEDAAPALSDITVSNNPARESVDFYLTHNRPESTLNVSIDIFSITGEAVWTHTEQGKSDVGKHYVLTWDLHSSAGGRVRPGIYFYRARISSEEGVEATKTKKLIVLGQ